MGVGSSAQGAREQGALYKFKNMFVPFCLLATQLWRNKIAAIANEYRDIKFAIADEDDQRHALAEFELDDSGEELNIGCYGSDKKKYRMDPMEEYDADDFKEWLDKFKEGRCLYHAVHANRLALAPGVEGGGGGGLY